MRLGILSDTHDRLARTRQAVGLLRDAGAEGLVHCGDLCGPEIVAACAVLPFWFVFGNHDGDSVAALHKAAGKHGAMCLAWGGEFVGGGKRIAVVHGHLGGDVKSLLAATPDYLLCGHSHLREDVRVGGVRRINPGALHRAETYTVALLDTATDELRFLALPATDFLSRRDAPPPFETFL